MTEQDCLRKAIQTTLIQVCKVGISFTSEISIEGTIGITVDKQTFCIVHFSASEKNEIEPNQEGQVDSSERDLPAAASSSQQVQSTSNMDASVYTPPVPNAQPPTAMLPPMSVPTHLRHQTPSAHMRLLGAEALFSLHDYFNKPTTSFVGEKDGQCMKDADLGTSKMPAIEFPDTIAIDIDSDSESFGGLHFDDYNNDKSKVFDNLEDKTGDNKGVIVIDDNADFLGPSGNDPSLSLGAGDLDCGIGGATSASTIDRTVDSEVGNGDSNSSSGNRRVASSGLGIARKNISAIVKQSKELERKETKRRSLKKPKLFDCEICGREFTNIGLVEAHLVGAHGVTETSTLGKITHFQCQYCKKKFRYQATLDKHVIRHNNSGAERPHRCSICKNGYRYEESLKIHLRVHEDSDSYECSVCDKIYPNKILLQKHIIYMHEVRRKSKSQKR